MSQKTIERRNANRLELERFVRILKKRDSLLTDFDEVLWHSVVDRLIMRLAELVNFIFKDGSEIEWEIG